MEGISALSGKLRSGVFPICASIAATQSREGLGADRVWLDSRIRPRNLLGVPGLHHLALRSQDPLRLADFYRELLDLKEIRRQVDAQGLRSVWLQASDTILMLERSESDSPQTGEPGIFLFAFSISAADRRDWQTKLETAEASTHQSDFSLYGKDPDGNRFALSHFPDRTQGDAS